jgi:hypothetical protein
VPNHFTADDIGRLAGESGDHRALVLTLAYTGVRWGVAVARRVRDVGSCGGGGTSTAMPYSSASTTRRADHMSPPAVRYRCLSSCSMNYRCSGGAAA